MKFNWKRDVLITLIFNFVTLGVLPTVSLAATERCAENNTQKIESTAGLAIAGGVLGYVLGRGKGAVVGASSGAVIGVIAAKRKPANCTPTEVVAPAQNVPHTPAPSLKGMSVVICFRSGTTCRPGQNGIEEVIEAAQEHFFSQLGARIVRAQSNSYGNPCERKFAVICVTNGTPVFYGSASTGNNNGLGLPHMQTQNGGSASDTRYMMIVSIDQYVDGDVIALANATGIGDAQSGNGYLSTNVYGPGGSIASNGYGSGYTTDQVAELDAARRATATLVAGGGWLPNAASDLSGAH